MYLPTHPQTNDPMINIQLTIHTAPDLCKNVSLTALFGSKGNSYTLFMQLDMCMYTYILHNIETLVRQKK